MTEARYVGDDVENRLFQLIRAAHGDKLRAGGMGGKDMKEGIQHALLTCLVLYNFRNKMS